MTSLLVLAALYLLAALVLILIIDRSVGMFFPASAKQPASAQHARRFWGLPRQSQYRRPGIGTFSVTTGWSFIPTEEKDHAQRRQIRLYRQAEA
jgi:hypothetical protein